MPDVEATRALIQSAKDWTEQVALDADTFSLIRKMWVALEEGVFEPLPPEPVDMGGHDARPADWTDPDQGPKSKKLSKIVKQAATRNHGGYPDESLMLLAEELKLNGL